MYYVRYEDGDSEHLPKSELKKLLDPMVYPPKPNLVPNVKTDGPAIVKVRGSNGGQFLYFPLSNFLRRQSPFLTRRRLSRFAM